jgi:integrase
VCSLLRARYAEHGNSHERQAAKSLIAQAGSLPPSKLSAAHVADLDEQIKHSGWTHATKVTRTAALRRILRWLWEYQGAPRLDMSLRRYPGLRPRNVTATPDELERIFAAAPPHLRLWLLLCSDLAIRSGTAARLAPEHYDGRRLVLSFTTKCGEKLTLPVTAEIHELIETCDHDSIVSFVRQLWIKQHRDGHPINPYGQTGDNLNAAFRALKRKLGITRKLTPHDLRRTTAVAMLQHTRDVRDVQALLGHRSLQATIWYLDHDLRPVQRETLETLKRPFLVKKEQTA